jgi:glycolate oxidase
LADILLAIAEMGEKYQLRCANLPRVTQPAPADFVRRNDPDQLHCCELFGADILKPVWPWAAR